MGGKRRVIPGVAATTCRRTAVDGRREPLDVSFAGVSFEGLHIHATTNSVCTSGLRGLIGGDGSTGEGDRIVVVGLETLYSVRYDISSR